MKKFINRLSVISLIAIILLNLILPVVQAALSTPPEELVEENNVVTTLDSYLILGLEYQAYNKAEYETNPLTATPKKTYVAGDIVKIDVKIKEAEGIGPITTCSYNVFYDINLLTLKSAETPMDKYGPFGTSIEDGYVGHQCSRTGEENMTVGSTVTNLIFEAKADSDLDNPTTIIIFNGDFSDENANPLALMGTMNTPSITIPEPQEQPELKTHGIEITKVDEEGNPITTSSAIYRITTPSGEKKLVQTNETVADGKLVLNDLTKPLELGEGTDTAEYIIEELSAPHGYVLDQVPKTLTVKFDTDGTILEAKIGETVQTVTNNIIALSFTNEKEEEPPVIPDSHVTFIINKIDEDDNPIAESSTSFSLKVTSEDIRYLTTTNGTVTKQLDIPEDISTPITYTLNEIKAPDGYVLDGQDINISVAYTKNADNTISVSSATKTSGENATISNVGNIITINVKNKEIKEQEKFQIEITKVNEAGNAITEDSAMFLITSPNNSSKIVETNVSDGKITLQENIPEGDLNPEGYTYKIQEIRAPNGYKNNSKEISLNIKFSDETGTRKVSSADITGSEGLAQGTISDNVVSFNIVNEKEEGNFTITLNKVNSEGNPITVPNVYFKLKKPNGETELLQTDAMGKIIYTEQMPEAEGEVEYKLQEIVAPDGYILNNNEQTIKLNFTKVSGIMTLSEATVVDPITKVGNVTNDNLTINFKNEEETPVVQNKDFTLSVNKIDKESGNLITNSTAIFQLLNPDGTSVGLFETDSSGIAKIKVELPETATTIEYKLIEKVAPNGYILDDSEKIISITFVENSGTIRSRRYKCSWNKCKKRNYNSNISKYVI